MAQAEFDWDAGNREKCRKHGLSIEEIEGVFAGSPRVAPDLVHSDEEVRLIAVGRIPGGPPVFVAFTLRQREGRTLIRPVSARYMHRKEAQRYEEGA